MIKMNELSRLDGIELYDRWFELMMDIDFREKYYRQLEYVIEKEQIDLEPFLKKFYPIGTFWNNDAMNKIALMVLYEFKDSDFYKTMVYLLFFPTDYIRKIITGYKPYMLFEDFKEIKSDIIVEDIELVLVQHLQFEPELASEFTRVFFDKLHEDNYSGKTYKSIDCIIKNLEILEVLDKSNIKIDYLEEFEIESAEDYFANNYEYSI